MLAGPGELSDESSEIGGLLGGHGRGSFPYPSSMAHPG
ncbi:hypothetical protein SCRES3_gp70 [Synechococcus phage S-CRES3]|nr:hypothetical protein SCRES3_gp70 [Synechococcus phage S-CRES3]